jgi:biotin synthase
MGERISRERVQALFDLPFPELMLRAMQVHKRHHDPTKVQFSTLMSVKTGACPEDCSYCSQSARWNTGLKREPLVQVDKVLAAARVARDSGSTRFCMGAAWRRVSAADTPKIVEMIQAVKDLGLETCVTLGTVSEDQAKTFADAGLDYYNHNLDTSREHYGDIITTRTYDERLQTLANVRSAGLKVCSGGILGIGETRSDRVGLLWELANLEEPPESVPINDLVSIEGTPMADKGVQRVDPLEFVRTIAVARIIMPTSVVRLSAGRTEMSDELQTMCFMAGANSMLTTDNPALSADRTLLDRLGMEPEGSGPSPTSACGGVDLQEAAVPAGK